MRKAQREHARRLAKANKPKPVSPPASPAWHNDDVARLRRRVRYVLLSTTLGALLLVRIQHDAVTNFLQTHGLGARLGFIMLMLAPALFTWLIGLGQLKDKAK